MQTTPATSPAPITHLTPVGGGHVRTSYCGVVCAPESDELRAITGRANGSSNRAHADCAACLAAAPALTEKYRVTFYDAKASRKGQGTRVAEFVSRCEAERFAVGRRYAARPAAVEVIAI